MKSMLLMVIHGCNPVLFSTQLRCEGGSRGLSREFIRANITFGGMHSKLTVKGVSCSINVKSQIKALIISCPEAKIQDPGA